MSSELVTKNDLKNVLNNIVAPKKTIGIVLYDNDDTTTSNCVLSDSAANYDKLVICYKNNNSHYSSVEVMHPNQKYVALTSTVTNTGSTAQLYTKSTTMFIDRVNIIPQQTSAGVRASQGQIPDGTVTRRNDHIITQVIGYKKANEEQTITTPIVQDVRVNNESIVNNGIANMQTILGDYIIVTTEGTITSSQFKQFGNVCYFRGTFQTNGAVTQGNNIYNGNIGSANIPLPSATCTTGAYYGAHSLAGTLSPQGGIVIRNTGPSALTISGDNVVNISFTYII